MVSGDEGSGKSWLIDALIATIDESATVLRATGHPDEQPLPYAALHRLVHPLVGRMSSVAAPRRRAVEHALRLSDGEAPDPVATAAGVLDLVVECAAERTIVVAVDDLHWVDVATRRVLTFLIHRIEADAVVVVLATRPTGSTTALPANCEQMPLEPLSAQASADVLRTYHPDLAQHVVNRLVSEADGLPLALVELAASLTAAQRRGAEPLPRHLPLPAQVAELHRPRIQSLHPDAQLALAIAALGDLGSDELTAAIAAAGLTVDALTPVETSGLLAVRADRVRLSHPTVRTAVIDTLPFELRTRARAAILGVLPEGSPRAAEHLAVLRRGPDELVAAAFAAAGREAWGRGGLAEAGQAWTRAAERSPDPAKAHRRRERAINALLLAGNMRAAATLLREQLAATDDRRERLGLFNRLVLATYMDDDPSAVDAVETEAWSLLDDDPAAATLLGPLLIAQVSYGNYRRAVAIADRLRAELPAALPTALAVYCDMADVLAARRGSGRVLLSSWADDLTDEQLAPPSMLLSPTLTVMSWSGAADEALRIADRAVAAHHGSRQSLHVIARSYVLMALGRWVEALAECTAAIDFSATTDLTRVAGYLHLFRAQLHAGQGNRDAMEADLAVAAHLPPARTAVFVPLIRGLLELGAGRPDDALDHLDAAGLAAARAGLVEPTFVAVLADRFEAAWLLGRAGELVAELDGYEQRADELGRRLAQALAARCRALLAAPGDFDAAFERSLRLHDGLDPFQRARTELAWGRRLRRERRTGDARVPLSRARDAFQALGAESWLRATITELEACGVRAGVVDDADARVRSLTPREREIAAAAASGLSNNEIAAKLYLSRRTAEYHLANVFTKLGINRRADLNAFWPRNQADR